MKEVTKMETGRRTLNPEIPSKLMTFQEQKERDQEEEEEEEGIESPDLNLELHLSTHPFLKAQYLRTRKMITNPKKVMLQTKNFPMG